MYYFDRTEFRESKELERKLFLRGEDEETIKVYDATNIIDRINIRFAGRKDNVAIVAKENILPLPFKGIPNSEYPEPWLTVSYREFHALIKATAYVLKKRYDFREGDRIGVTANSLPLTQLFIYSLWTLRCTVVLIPPKLGNDVKQYWVRHNDIKMIFYDINLRIHETDEENNKLNEQGEWIWPWVYPLTEIDVGLSAGEKGVPMTFMYHKNLCEEIYQAKLEGKSYCRKGDADDIVCIVGTSSSSQAIIKNGQCSQMKFVPIKLPHAFYKYDQVLVPFNSLHSRFYLNVPFHHSIGACIALTMNLTNGGATIYHTQQIHDIGFIPEIILDDMAEVNATFTYQFPFHYAEYKKLFEENHPRCPVWAKYLSNQSPPKVFRSGGAPMNPVVRDFFLNKFGIKFGCTFGSSEAGMYLASDVESEPLPGEEGYFKRIPWIDFCIKPLDEKEPNIGELYVHADSQCTGYVGRAKPGEFYDSSLPGMRCDIGADELFEEIEGVPYVRTNDIFIRSEKSGKYKFITRVDSILTFATGLKMNPVPFEETVSYECDDITRCCLILDSTLTEVICFVEPNWSKIMIDGKAFDTSQDPSTLSKETIKRMKKQAQQQTWNTIYKVLMDDSKCLTNWTKQLTINNIYVIDYGKKFPSTDKGSLSRRVARLQYSYVLKYISKLISGEITELPDSLDEEEMKNDESNKLSVTNNIDKIVNMEEQREHMKEKEKKMEWENRKVEEEEEDNDSNDDDDDDDNHNDSNAGANGKTQEEIDEEIQKTVRIIYDSIKEIIPSTPDYEEFNPERPFNIYGIDSLATIKLTNVLSRKLGKQFSPAILFNYGTSVELAKFLTNNKTSNAANVNTTSEGIPRSLGANGFNEKIAIIGMALRLPGSINSSKSFWMSLARGKNCVLPPIKTRDLHHGYVNKPSSELVPGEHNIPAIGCYDTRSGVAKPSQFDAEFFNCLPDEALALDPRHRWVLETSWEALENAGIPPSSLENSLTGVFVGISQDHEYADLLEENNINVPIAAHATSQSGIAGRLSFFYRLYGPSFTMDTACSTGASAVHSACRSLQHRDCNLSIVSGVRYLYSSKAFYRTCSARMTSPNGRCATFDKDADGFATGEGCVTFILKRLDDAIRDNDNILSVILSTSSGQSGLRQSISAPSSEAQALNIRRAMEFAGIKPEDVSYVEAHGTGTPLGDALEVHSLNQIYAGSHTKENPLIVGSVKTNIGHTGEVAGLAGMAKVILAMHHKRIPKNLHFHHLNPEIDIKSIPIKIPKQRLSWTSKNPNKPLIAQVSSFGLQGSIVHIFLEEYIPKERQIASSDAAATTDEENDKKEHVKEEEIEEETNDEDDEGQEEEEEEGNDEDDDEKEENINENENENHVLTVSAKSFNALDELCNNYISILEEMEDENKNIRDLCYTSNIGREQFSDYRISVCGKNASELCNELEIALDKYEEKIEMEREQQHNENTSKKPTQLLNVIIENLKESASQLFNSFLLELYVTRPEFKKAIDFCDSVISEITDKQYSLVSNVIAKQENKNSQSHVNEKYQSMILASFYYGLSKTLSKEIDSTTTPVNIGYGVLGELISVVLNGGISFRKLIHLLKLMQESKLNEQEIKTWYELKDKKEHKLKGNMYSVSQQREFKSGEIIPEEYYVQLLLQGKKEEGKEKLEKVFEDIIEQYGKKCKTISIFNEDLSKDQEVKEMLLQKIEEKKYHHLSEDHVISFFNNTKTKSCKDENQCVKRILPNYLSEMYNSGNDIQWTVFHQRINNNNLQKYSVHKIHLPNYPFQRLTFWPKVK